MKISSAKTKIRRGEFAFTLTEMMVAVTTFVIVMGAVIACNLFGLSMAARQQVWLAASDDTAQAISTLMGNIRSASSLAVGSYSNSVFIPVATGVQQSGNALMLTNVTSSLTTITLYYLDTNSGYLMETNNYSTGIQGDYKQVSSNPMTNDVNHPIFTEVDYTGTPLTTATTLASIGVYLSFTSLQNSQVIVQSGGEVNQYLVTATVTPRL